jgi:hypothetical protein
MTRITRIKAVLYLLLLTFYSCGLGEDTNSSFDPSFYRSEMVHIESSYDNCKAGKEDCTYITFDYPVFKNPETSEILIKIDDEIKKMMLLGTETDNLEKATELFINNYSEFLNDPEIENYNTPWFDIRKAEWLVLQKKVLSLKCSITNFYGGAHPNQFVMLRNFNPYTGDSLGLGMIFNPKNLEELSRLGEKYFREDQKLKHDESFEDAGYWFKDNQFFLTDNFAFTHEGLLFYYNEYEVAPYSLGAIYFVVPYSIIMHLFE